MQQPDGHGCGDSCEAPKKLARFSNSSRDIKAKSKTNLSLVAMETGGRVPEEGASEDSHSFRNTFFFLLRIFCSPASWPVAQAAAELIEVS